MPQDVRSLRLFMTADAVGGVFQYALDLAQGLTGHGVQTTLAMLGPAMSADQRALAKAVPGLSVMETGLPLDWLAEKPEQVHTGATQLASLAAREGADVVHLNTPALAVAAFPAPVVAVAHSCVASWWVSVKRSELPADFIWRTRLMARGLKAADAVVCPSTAFAKLAQDIYGCIPVAVHNGRAEPPILPASTIPPPLAFTAGRLWDEGKDIVTLDAAAEWISIPFQAAGPLAGPDGSRRHLRRLSPVGTLDDTQMRLRLARRPIFVSAALYEPFGLTALEAAQAGCALVLSDIPTFRELWDGAALFVPPREPRAFAAAVNRLASDPVRRARLGAAARKRAKLYSVEAMAGRMAQFYRALATTEPAQMPEAAE